MHNRLLVALASLAALFFFDTACRAQPPDEQLNTQTTPAQSSPAPVSPTEALTSESAATDFKSTAPLQYDPKSGQKYSYEFEIAIRGADETTFYKGTTHYTVDEVTDQQIRLTYQGGLHESTKAHESRKSGIIPFGTRDVAIIYRGWGSNRRGTFGRADVQLAPPEVDQPRHTATETLAIAPPATSATQGVPLAASANIAATTIKSRSWSDVSGTFRVEALYLGKQGENVLLRRSDGKEVAVPLARLSVDDQRYVATLLEEAQRLGNPFEPNPKP